MNAVTIATAYRVQRTVIKIHILSLQAYYCWQREEQGILSYYIMLISTSRFQICICLWTVMHHVNITRRATARQTFALGAALRTTHAQMQSRSSSWSKQSHLCI